MYKIDHQTLLGAAQEKYGRDIEISQPYWVDEEIVRVGITIGDGIDFGANFYYKLGVFK